MANPLARLHLGDLLASTSFRFLGLGFAWSWAWTIWGALSSLAGGSSFGIASSPAWIASAVACIVALPLLGRLMGAQEKPASGKWIAAAALLSTAGSIALGACALGGAPLPLHLAAGAAIGAGSALLYLLWTDGYTRAPQVRPTVAVPLCAAVTVIPVVIISGSVALASWIFAASLPAISSLMLLSFLKRDATAKPAARRGSAPSARETARALWAPAFGIASFYGLVGVTTGTATFVGVGIAGVFEGVFAAAGAVLALVLAVAAHIRPRTAPAPDYLRWTLALGTIGALLYLQWFDELRLAGVTLFRVAEVLAFIYMFTFALIQARAGRVSHLTAIVVLMAASQSGSLAGNLAGQLWGAVYEGAGEFMLVSFFASLCLIAGLFVKPAAEAVFEAPPAAESSAGDDIETTCDAVARAYALAPRQRDVLVHLACGRTAARTAQALTMSENTVASYTKQIYARLGVHSKQELIDFVRYYRQQNGRP